MPTGGVAEVVPFDLGEEHRPDSGGSRTWVKRGLRPRGRDVVGVAGGGAHGARRVRRAGQPLSLTGRQPVFASPQFSRRLSRPAWKNSHHAVVGDRRCPHRRARPTPTPRFPQPIQQVSPCPKDGHAKWRIETPLGEQVEQGVLVESQRRSRALAASAPRVASRSRRRWRRSMPAVRVVLPRAVSGGPGPRQLLERGPGMLALNVVAAAVHTSAVRCSSRSSRWAR
jgi:hypothetical protein